MKALHFENEYLPNQMLEHYIEHVPSLLVVGMGTAQNNTFIASSVIILVYA